MDYRKIVPIEKELQVEAGIDRVEGRKIFVAGRLLDGEAVLAEADALFVQAATRASRDREQRPDRALGALARPAAGPAAADSSTASSSAVVGLAVLASASSRSRIPGPGWAIVFVGLAILATEFDWARRLLAYARERYDEVMALVQAAGHLGAGAGRRAHRCWSWWRRCGCSARSAGRRSWSGIEHAWLKSPIGLGS